MYLGGSSTAQVCRHKTALPRSHRAKARAQRKAKQKLGPGRVTLSMETKTVVAEEEERVALLRLNKPGVPTLAKSCKTLTSH